MQRTAFAAFLVSLLLMLLLGGTIHLRSDDGIAWESEKFVARFSKSPIQLSFDSESPFFMSEIRTTPFGLAATVAVLFGVLFALFAAAGWRFSSRDENSNDPDSSSSSSSS